MGLSPPTETEIEEAAAKVLLQFSQCKEDHATAKSEL